MMEDIELYGLAYNSPTLRRHDSCPINDFDKFIVIDRVKRIIRLCKEESDAIRQNLETFNKYIYSRQFFQ